VVLLDSSVWVLVEHGRVELRDLIPPGETVATCPVVVSEVLRGTRGPKQYQIARAMLMAAEMVDAPTPLERFEEAAQSYLACRDAGVTPSSVDCLVAVCAIANRATLLHRDSDFDHIARVLPLKAVRI
jgi:predicted nucleic acid-binding protein